VRSVHALVTAVGMANVIKPPPRVTVRLAGKDTTVLTRTVLGMGSAQAMERACTAKEYALVQVHLKVRCVRTTLAPINALGMENAINPQESVPATSTGQVSVARHPSAHLILVLMPSATGMGIAWTVVTVSVPKDGKLVIAATENVPGIVVEKVFATRSLAHARVTKAMVGKIARLGCVRSSAVTVANATW